MDVLEQKAKNWVKTSDYQYQVESRQSEHLLIFTLNHDNYCLSFFVNCPETEDGKWSVWSEYPELLPHLQAIIEFCDSSRIKSLEEVLDKTHSAVKQVCQTKESDDEDEDEDEDDFDEAYYNNDEDFDKEEIVRPDSEEDEEESENFFGCSASPAAFQRLTKDLKNMRKEAHKFGIIGNPRGDNLFIWDVKLTGFPDDSKLGKDLLAFARKFNREPVVYLEMQFPGEYPMAPPFVRITRPRFKFLTGHVTIGGSICMEMLTLSGWRPTNDIESILVQIRSEIMSDPNARLDGNPDREYTEAEAKDAFNRMVSRYGWNK